MSQEGCEDALADERAERCRVLCKLRCLCCAVWIEPDNCWMPLHMLAANTVESLESLKVACKHCALGYQCSVHALIADVHVEVICCLEVQPRWCDPEARIRRPAPIHGVLKNHAAFGGHDALR